VIAVHFGVAVDLAREDRGRAENLAGPFGFRRPDRSGFGQ